MFHITELPEISPRWKIAKFVPMEARSGHWDWTSIPWDGDYRWLYTTVWVLGIKLKSSRRSTSGLNY